MYLKGPNWSIKHQLNVYVADTQVLIERFIKFLYSRIIVKQLSPYLTQAEGFVTGVGVRMFTIAGPVILYGTAASVVYGFLYWLMTI